MRESRHCTGHWDWFVPFTPRQLSTPTSPRGVSPSPSSLAIFAGRRMRMGWVGEWVLKMVDDRSPP